VQPVINVSSNTDKMLRKPLGTPFTTTIMRCPDQNATHRARTVAELLIDCEEDRVLQAVLVGMLRESERRLLRGLARRCASGVRQGGEAFPLLARREGVEPPTF
jgi:hypothetical protein